MESATQLTLTSWIVKRASEQVLFHTSIITITTLFSILALFWHFNDDLLQLFYLSISSSVLHTYPRASIDLSFSSLKSCEQVWVLLVQYRVKPTFEDVV